MTTAVSTYPNDWPMIAQQVKDRAAWRCVRCGMHHTPRNGYTMTVHHLDGDKSNCERWNLAALCQRCHLTIQGRMKLNQLFLFPTLHSQWLRPFLIGRQAATGEKLVTL